MQESLFKQLQDLEKETFGDNDFRISSNIKNYLIPVSDLLLNTIPSYMPEYTLHNINHCETILDNIRKILPDAVKLNIVELTILIQAVYLHDIGMVVNRSEAKNIKESPEFKSTFINFDSGTDEDEILTEYIRQTHVSRSIAYIDLFASDFATYKIDFSFQGIDLSDWIKSVILSHAKNVNYLKDEDQFPKDKLIQSYKVDIQYLSCLLRLGDILDFDIFRTPPFLYKHINPQNKISIEEWKKHQSIEGKYISDNLISFEAKCSSAKIERSVRNFINWIDIEIRETLELLDNNNNNHYLSIKSPIDFKCRNNGTYIFTDLQINLDYEKVLNILMGTELYDSPNIFIRELIQNSYDACKLRAEKAKRYNEAYTPQIKISYLSHNSTLIIEDNGIGIDEDIFAKYLTTIGKSYYKSKEFQSNNYNFSPISNFGIGIISCFMVSDSIEIDSARYYEPLQSPIPIHYILNLNDKFTEKRKSLKQSYGTKITLNLRDDFKAKLADSSLLNIIQSNMCYQEIPILLDIDGTSTLLDSKSIVVPDEYKYINNILIFNIENQDWIEGHIIVHGWQHQGIIKQTKVSQQCFTITSNSNNLSLSPVWLQMSQFAINISPPRKLKLKANRNKIDENEDFFFLKEYLLEFIINKFESEEYNDQLQNFLTSKPFYFSGNKNEYLFLTKNIKFNAIISDNIEQITLQQIAKTFSKQKIALLHRDYIKNELNISKIRPLFNDYSCIIIQDNSTDFFFGFIAPYVKEYKAIVTQTAGVVYYELNLCDNINPDVNDYVQKNTGRSHKLPEEIQIQYNGATDNIFCIIGNNQYNNLDLLINTNHRLGKLLKETKNTSFTKRFIGSFETNLSLSLNSNEQLEVYNNYNGQHHITLNNYEAYALKSIKIISLSFIESLNHSLLHDLLIPLKESIGYNEDYDYFLLSENDFPYWWIN
ncbi:ATP-binding protein [Hymenobacter sp. 5516J-16]|uniref:HD domain-containing protein n=1 Tax=Hymenobacter sp. 5516J-16 TaxID=2932253 RepID=UPI001FD15A81|nr:ATP-binding protein [Hymenobacter sp. 5516J-16]UOQ77651.1 ATP-binding protein [Hymenobacter sp. 5516J-16]